MVKRLAVGLAVLVGSGCQERLVVNPTTYVGSAVVFGQVSTESGQPVAGAEIEVIAHEETCDDRGVWTESADTTDSVGEFKGEFIISSPGGPVDVTAECTEIVVTVPGASAPHRTFAGSLRFADPMVDSLGVTVEMPE